MRTPWGYDVASALPPLIDTPKFNRLTGSRFASDAGLLDTLSAVSQAVRNACGWHIAPSVACTETVTAEGRYARLSTMCLNSVTSVTEDGTALAASAYESRREGLIRRVDGQPFSRKWDGLTVAYTSGFDIDDALAQTVAQIASNALAAPAGVREEHAGNVGISYNQWDGIAGGVSLTDRDLMMLEPYRMPQVM